MDVVLSRLGTQLLSPTTDELLFREPATLLSRYVYPRIEGLSASIICGTMACASRIAR